MTALCPFCVVRLALSDKFHDLRMICFLRVTQELFVQMRPLQSVVLDADKVKDDVFGDVVSIGHAVSYTRRGVHRNCAPSVALRIVSLVCVSFGSGGSLGGHSGKSHPDGLVFSPDFDSPFGREVFDQPETTTTAIAG